MANDDLPTPDGEGERRRRDAGSSGPRGPRGGAGGRPSGSGRPSGGGRPGEGGRSGGGAPRRGGGSRQDRDRREFGGGARRGERDSSRGGFGAPRSAGPRDARSVDARRSEGRPQGDRGWSRGDGERPSRPPEGRRDYSSRDGDRGPRSSDGRRSFSSRDGDRGYSRRADDRGYSRRDDERGYSRRDGERGFTGRDGERRPPRDQSRSGRPGERRGPARGASARGGDAKRFGERGMREERTRPRVEAPDVPEEITGSMLDREARTRLRTLSKENAEDVGRHLVMAGMLLDEDPERAYKHAKVAVERAGRVDIAREAAAMTAYATGRFAEALREFRTVTRLNGRHDHLALVADCERGLGRPERALEVAAGPEAAALDAAATAELQMVVAGARSDLGQVEAALLTLDRIRPADEGQAVRVTEARADVLRAAGRADEADALLLGLPQTEDDTADDDEDVVVYDLEDEEEGQA